MDDTTKQWLDGMNELKSDGFIIQEKDYIDPELVNMIVKKLKEKGIKFNTEEERKKVANQLVKKLLLFDVMKKGIYN